MDDTVLTDSTYSYKGQPLRITFKKLDYQIQILHRNITRDTREIRILLDGIVQTLTFDGNRWCFAETEDNTDFAQAIWNAVCLRYRL
ncbi:hypothetical protein H8S90_14340 [Olivibacter sp. SDN3]|uniref:hypothetical protein n=1 Tax=Olivibacter sp. SDN3 TaxID=2764720 RepID=UPI00165161BA|nr:hypothetical protein [Olivibacter sp. SDN3]QNL47988.1 hypothetical protein H8S90_14340 [Olivibacter sp. SDN3]